MATNSEVISTDENNIDELFFSVNDIYSQYDEGLISKTEALEIARQTCKRFLGLRNGA